MECSTWRYTVQLDSGEAFKVKWANVRAEVTTGGAGGAGAKNGKGKKGKKALFFGSFPLYDRKLTNRPYRGPERRAVARRRGFGV